MSLHVDPRAFQALEGRSRGDAVRHLRDCASCRAGVAREDPSALFALLATVPLPRRILDASTPRVRDLESRGWDGSATIRWAPRWTALAASLALAAVLGFAAFRSGPLSPPPAARAELDASPRIPQVVDLTVGTTRVVMIFDSRISL